MSLLDRIFRWRKREQGGTPKAARGKDTSNTVVHGRSPGRDSFLHALLGSSGDEQTLSVPQQLVMQVVEKRLRSPKVEQLPRLPAVIPKLLRAIRDPDASKREWGEIIRKDPALATAVLRLANSVYYNHGQGRITSIERAVATLGAEGLRSVLTAAVMQPLIQVKSPLYANFGRQLWEHSLHCGICAELLAERNEQDRFKGYLLGLLHDLGAIVIFHELVQAFREHAGVTEPSPAAFVPLLQSHAMAMSCMIATHWELPGDLLEALREQEAGSPPSTVLGQLLGEANTVAELYFLVRTDRLPRDSAEQWLRQRCLPVELLERLDALSVEV